MLLNILFSAGILFRLSFCTAIFCSGDQDLDGLEGTLQSPNYPNNYDDDTDCSFLIDPIPGTYVTLKFTDFHVDYSHGGECADYIEMIPPVNHKSQFCGFTIGSAPGEGKTITFQEDESVIVIFHSDGFGSNSGFNALFHTVISLTPPRDTK